MFRKETYSRRRQELKERLQEGIILLLGNEESRMNYPDNTYPFRQDSSFLYFFGLDRPGLVAVIDIDDQGETIFGDDIGIEDIIWTGPRMSLLEQCSRVGVTNVRKSSAIASFLSDAESSGRAIHFLPPYRPENKLKIQEWLQVKVPEQNAKASVPLIKAIVAQRSVKSDEEIAEIEKAINISALMQTKASQMAVEGQSETIIAGALEGIAVGAGGRLSFPSIITVNGQILHNHSQGNQLQKGQMLLCDCGADTPMHYSSDLTRTTPVDEQFTSRQKNIYSIVRTAHESAINRLRPGIRYLDVHLHACEKLAEGLKELGLMKGDVHNAVRQGAHAIFFQCGLGHLLGLDAHDMEDLGEQYTGYTDDLLKSTQFGLKSLRLGREVHEGFVLTVEPGIYFIPELIDLWKSERKFEEYICYDVLENYKDFGGIRIEDDVLITSYGHRLLGTPLERDTEKLKKL
jgi:Xaa-Pro aminopeptidase